MANWSPMDNKDWHELEEQVIRAGLVLVAVALIVLGALVVTVLRNL